MSESPNFSILLKRIGTFLAEAEAEGKKKKDLKAALKAYEQICKIFYGKSTRRCSYTVPYASPL